MTHNPTLTAGVSYYGQGLGVSVSAMATQMEVLKAHADNIANFGVPGYRKTKPFVTSFAQYLGPDGIDNAKIDEIGRLRQTNQPLDLALAEQGYFKVQAPGSGTISHTRDGRFQLTKEGLLQTQDGKSVLNSSGQPIKLSSVPGDLKRGVKIDDHGVISVLDPLSGTFKPEHKLAVVDEAGSVAKKTDVKQGYVEDSNVMLQEEFVGLIPLRRHFEANRQVFMLQNDNLSKLISELGRG
ncbi:MAG: flagellar hook basal-body protein [Vampirovibrionales bacterium]|nr:flagellar hook basal-body protein [Vampirovibrionales bacterium]